LSHFDGGAVSLSTIAPLYPAVKWRCSVNEGSSHCIPGNNWESKYPTAVHVLLMLEVQVVLPWDMTQLQDVASPCGFACTAHGICLVYRHPVGGHDCLKVARDFACMFHGT